MGIGWHQPEFEGYSKRLETSDRIVATDEGLQFMKRLWTDEHLVSFAGKFIQANGAILDPKPVQKTVSADLVWIARSEYFETYGQTRRRLDTSWTEVGR